MIVARILGGLGNQMFQYAAAHSLAQRTQQPLRLDISGFEGYQGGWTFDLQSIFNIHTPAASQEDMRRVLGWKNPHIVRRFLSIGPLRRFAGKNLIMEQPPNMEFDSRFLSIKNFAYLSGYWQSEKYFHSDRQLTRSLFTFPEKLSEANQETISRIMSTCAVAVHVRRGDYVSDAKSNAILGTCPLQYYKNAIRYISERAANPEFFVFSDDIEWARENLKFPSKANYVDHNSGAESFNDMRLMHLCKHNIIANSSFSWWGAWLNRNHDQIVVAPKNWYRHQQGTGDIVPERWVLL